MEWVFWIGVLCYIILGELISRKYKYETERKLFFTTTRNVRFFMSPKEKNIILLMGLLIFFFWPFFLIHNQYRKISK